MIGEGETWGSRWSGSRSELSRKVEAYARSIGQPYEEVLLTLLHAAVQDIASMDGRNRFLLGMFEDFGGEMRAELRRRGWTQQHLADVSGVSRATICNIAQRRRNASMATASEIVGALIWG